MKNIRHHSEEITIHRGDLRDKHSVDQALSALKDYGDTLVFRAQAHVGESWGRPYETVQTNITGTLNLLQSIIDPQSSIQQGRVRSTGTSAKR